MTIEHVRADGLMERITELEARVNALEAGAVIDYGAPFNDNEECIAHTCSYFTGYLVYGPADLCHEAYHAAETCAEAHSRTCTHNWEHGPCPRHIEWERRVRA